MKWKENSYCRETLYEDSCMEHVSGLITMQ